MSLIPKAPVAPTPPAPVFNPPTRWVLGVLSWLAFGISAYLAWGSITQTPVAGCGVGSHAGCDAVLNSPWSKWLGVPVSVAGLACYASLAGLSVLLGIRDARASRWINTAFVMLAVMAAGASLWFIALQIFVIGEFCWYCLTTDVCGIAIGAISAWAALRAPSAMPQLARVANSSAGLATLRSALPAGPRPASVPMPGAVRTPVPVRIQSAPPSLAIAFGGAGALLLVLIGGQIAFRAKTYDVQKVALDEEIDMSGNNGEGGETTAADTRSDEASTTVAMRIPPEENEDVEHSTEPATASDGNGNETSDADASAQNASANNGEVPAEPVKQTAATNGAAESTSAKTGSATPERERKVKLLNGKLTFDVYKHPLIGSPDAKYVVAELISYDCPHCRKTHRLMKQAMSRYGDQVALIVLTVPLEKGCNRLITDSAGSHAGACTTTRMALGVAKLKPTSFGRFHDYLMSGSKEKPPALDSIIAKAYNTVDRNRLRDLRTGDTLDKEIAANVNLFDTLRKQNSGKKEFGLPIQIIGDHIMSGSVEKAGDIYKAWEKHLGVKPR